jgi:hypothetical protein
MDELRSFFNNPRPSSSQAKKLRGPLIGGVRITKEDTSNLMNRREEHRHAVVPSGIDYASEVKKREIDIYLKVPYVYNLTTTQTCNNTYNRFQKYLAVNRSDYNV